MMKLQRKHCEHRRTRLRTSKSINALVEEPAKRDAQQTLPVPPEDEPVRDILADGGFTVAFGFARHPQAPEEHEEGGNDPESEGQAPDCSEVVFGKDPQQNERDECGDHEADVDLRVQEISIGRKAS